MRTKIKSYGLKGQKENQGSRTPVLTKRHREPNEENKSDFSPALEISPRPLGFRILHRPQLFRRAPSMSRRPAVAIHARLSRTEPGSLGITVQYKPAHSAG